MILAHDHGRKVSALQLFGFYGRVGLRGLTRSIRLIRVSGVGVVSWNKMVLFDLVCSIIPAGRPSTVPLPLWGEF